MLKKKLTKWFLPVIVLGLLGTLILIGCQTVPASRTPQMGEEAVIDLPLGDLVYLDLTDDEALKIYTACPIGYGKILKNQERWKANYDLAITVKEGYKEYLRGIFAKKEEPPSKKWWKFWE
jgi:hypothetical protein